MRLFVYLGNDDWEKEDRLRNNLKKWLGSGEQDPLAKQTFFGSDFSLDDFSEAYQSLSLFAEKRALIIRHGERISLSQQNKLADLLKKPQEETCVFLLAEKLDGRGQLKKMLAKNGVVEEYKLPYPNQLPSWLSQRSQKKFKRKLAFPDAKFLCESVGENVFELEAELKKLDTYLQPGFPITAKDIEALIQPHGEVNLFDFLYHAGMGHRGKSLALLSGLLADAMPPFLVAIRLFYHYLQLARVQAMLGKGTNSQAIATALKINTYIFDKKRYADQARTRSETKWKEHISMLAKLESDFKRGKYAERFEAEMAFAAVL